MYEINTHLGDNNGGGREIRRSYKATEITFAKRDRLDAIGFKQVGKNRFTWIRIATTDYMKKKYEEFAEVIVTDAATGKRIFVFNY